MAGKKKTNSKSVSKQYQGSSFGLVLGYVLLVFATVALLAMVSHGYGGSRGNWMGPYLGDALAQNLCLLFGNLPAVLFLLASVATGLRLVLGNRVPPMLRIAVGLWSLMFWGSMLLTIRISDLAALSSLHLTQNGGLFGVFLVRQLVEPAFGLSRVGPTLIGLCGILLTSVIAFGLRVHHIKPALIWFAAMWQKLQSTKPAPTRSVDVEPVMPIRPMHRNEDTSDFEIRRLNQVKPFKIDEQEPVLLKAATPVADVPRPLPLPATPAQQDAVMRQIENALLNAQNLDLREVRRLRDELAELRRIQQMNNWENRQAGDIRVEGNVKKDDDSAEELTPLEQAKTVVMPRKADAVMAQKVEAVVRDIPVQMPVQVEAKSLSFRDDGVFDGHLGTYLIPKVGAVLGEVPVQPIDYSQEELKQFGALLEQQLENFRIKGKVVHISTGPVITRFEIEPGPGVKVARFAGLSDDLALALKANSIRVLAPIPGKSVVGIEIPNRKAQTVFCREILESPRFLPDPYTLQIVLGKDIMGNAFVMDLARAPHLLIAGQTGSGKSVCINTLMASLLFSKSPDDLRMILVDPKVVELKSYEKIPHLLHPVVTDPGTAVQALQWACYEMDRRYELLAKAGVRNITGFNQKLAKGEIDGNESIDAKDKRRMPFIVIVVDEFADVIMQAKKEFEDPVIRLAQKARAAGMHMVLATQRPSTNVITGIIKANLPTRISFKVASHIDARTVLDHAGAERLLGRGDMLFRSIDDPEPIRVHGAFLTDNEAEQVARACSEQDVDYPQLTSFLLTSGSSESEGEAMDSDDKDELFWDAAELCALQGGGSTSLLQRRFSIGYARAGRIMDGLYRAGVVGPERGSKPRECLMSMDEISQLRRTRGV